MTNQNEWNQQNPQAQQPLFSYPSQPSQGYLPPYQRPYAQQGNQPYYTPKRKQKDPTILIILNYIGYFTTGIAILGTFMIALAIDGSTYGTSNPQNYMGIWAILSSIWLIGLIATIILHALKQHAWYVGILGALPMGIWALTLTIPIFTYQYTPIN